MSLSVRPLREKFGALPLGLTALMAGVAAADTFTPLGFAHGMLYVPLLVWAGLYGSQTLLASAALLAVLFTGLGVWTSPPPPAGIGEPVAWANRILASVVGEDGLSPTDRQYLAFGQVFEREVISHDQPRSLDQLKRKGLDEVAHEQGAKPRLKGNVEHRKAGPGIVHPQIKRQVADRHHQNLERHKVACNKQKKHQQVGPELVDPQRKARHARQGHRANHRGDRDL